MLHELVHRLSGCADLRLETFRVPVVPLLGRNRLEVLRREPGAVERSTHRAEKSAPHGHNGAGKCPRW
jgi:hypothetical protein